MEYGEQRLKSAAGWGISAMFLGPFLELFLRAGKAYILSQKLPELFQGDYVPGWSHLSSVDWGLFFFFLRLAL